MLKHDLNALYEPYGYRRIRLPKFEPYDLYAENRDFINAGQLITFTDVDGTLMALRPDVTLSVLKAYGAAEAKVYYNETVYRPVDGRFREIAQTGVERIGTIDAQAEAEMVALAARSTAMFGEDCVIRLSDTAFLKKLFESFSFSEDLRRRMIRLFTHKNAAGIDVLVKDGRLAAPCADAVKKLMELYMPLEEGIALLGADSSFAPCREETAALGDLARALSACGITDRVYLDFSLVNSMDYYSGILFQGTVPDIPYAVVSGGRYDGLAKKMGCRGGAIGFSVYLDAVRQEGESTRMINVALPKGRLGETTYGMLAAAGYECPSILKKNRKLTFENPEKGIRYFWVKPADVPVYVARGTADIGICGKDILMESDPDVYELLDLNTGRCRMCVAGPEDFEDDGKHVLRVATKFPRIAARYFEQTGREADIIKLNGSVEIAPVLKLADVIVDIVETGKTLKANNLEVKRVFADISARLIANRVSYQFAHEEISALRERLSRVVSGEIQAESVHLEH